MPLKSPIQELYRDIQNHGVNHSPQSHHPHGLTHLMQTPTVSVVIAAYNAESTIQRAIDSILTQTYDALECIVVDDGSTDSTAAIVQDIDDPRLILIQQSNGGISNARNAGGRAARGVYLAVQDADDVSLPERIAEQIAYLDAHPDVVLLGTNQTIVSPEGRHPGPYYNDKTINRILGHINPIAHTSVLMRKSAYDAIGGYNESFQVTVDYELYLRIHQKGPIAMLEAPLVEYYVHGGSVTAKKKWLQCRNAFLARVRYGGNLPRALYHSLYQCLAACAPAWLIAFVRTRKGA